MCSSDLGCTCHKALPSIWTTMQGLVTEKVMVHPSDGEAWKEFDKEYKKFAEEVRNVRLCLATDGFTPFGMIAASYSCWPVFVVPYNLPPEMCMKQSNLILALVIPGPDYPGKTLNDTRHLFLLLFKKHLCYYCS